MKNNKVVIVGSGIVGSIMAYLLAKKGFHVDVFEKGPEYPYPHKPQFREKVNYLYDNPVYRLSEDIKGLAVSGDYQVNLNNERFMLAGGSATRWEAVTLRMCPEDFRTKTLFGYADDWPLTYDLLEPYYCKAEGMLGVSGTDIDNPFAPKRSRPYPLPPFELSYDDRLLSEKLKANDIILHTTPQARTRRRYEGRSGCVNYGVCEFCPIGARYSPNYHLELAVKTGLCTLHTNVSVRRVTVEKNGRAGSIVYQKNDSDSTKEHNADIVIIASGALESARLLLLSKDGSFPDGVGNNSGFVGKNLMFHHLWAGQMFYKEKLYPGRVGPHTGQSHQFVNIDERGKHGGAKIEFASRFPVMHYHADKSVMYKNKGSELVREFEPLLHRRPITFHSETVSDKNKYMGLSDRQDRFGDPFAHVHYESNDFDRSTYKYVQTIFDRFVNATGPYKADFNGFGSYRSGAHHMGTVRMGNSEKDSVVDKFCRVHGLSNLYVVGGSNFVTSTAVNPTLTIVAISILVSEFIADQG